MSVFTAQKTTTANPHDVWRALTDVTDWPRWSASYDSVQRLDDGPLAVGSRARVKQPRLAPATYEVTELDEGHVFTWTSKAPGVHTIARHRLVPAPDGTRVELAAELSGWLAGAVSAVLGRRIQRYVELEAAAITAAAEAAGAETE